MRSERCTPIVKHCIFRLGWIFVLINKVEGSPEFFFVDCSIGDAKLVFVPRYSVVSDALIEIGVHLLLHTKL